MTGIFESTWLQSVAPRGVLDRYYVRELPDDGTYEIDWVQGSALLARREVFEQIGGLDPGYIMYSEELDWCRRAKLAGWKVVYMGDVFVTHHHSQSADQIQTQKHIHFQKSKLRYFRKFHGAGAALVLRLVLLGNYAMQIILEGGKLALGRRPELRRERIISYAAVLRALLGLPGAR